VICPSGRFVEPIEKIDFYMQGLFDENFCDGGGSMRGFNPSGKSPVPPHRHCDKREAFAQGSPCDEAIHLDAQRKNGLLRGACHRAARRLSSGAHSRDPLAPTRWLAMTMLFFAAFPSIV